MKTTSKIVLSVGIPLLAMGLVASAYSQATTVSADHSTHAEAANTIDLNGQPLPPSQSATGFHAVATGAGFDQNVMLGTSLQQRATIPEPSTILSGLLLLLPFGACALRIFRKRKSV
jgi:hypothetical protein